MYGAGEFTPYEIDSEKKIRYKGEVATKPKSNLKNVLEINTNPSQDENFEEGIELKSEALGADVKSGKKESLSSIADISKHEKKTNILSKFWQKLTESF